MTTDGPHVHRLYVLMADDEDGVEARGFIRDVLPVGWVLADEPDGAAAIFAVDGDLDSATVRRALPALRVVATSGPTVAGAVDGHAEVQVLTLPNESAFSRISVAEFAVTLMLTLAHNILTIAREMRAAEWLPGRDVPVLTDQETYVYNWPGVQGSGFLRGNVVGLVGVGTIGANMAKLLAPFGVRLRYNQRHRLPIEDEQRLGVEWREFDDLLRESDFLVLNHRLQLGPGGNENQFGAREFAMMKPTAFLINTARGRVIDDDALVGALKNGEIAGVGLDVFRYEPLPKEHPLLAMADDRVILTPHIAAGTEVEYWRYTLRTVLEAYAG